MDVPFRHSRQVLASTAELSGDIAPDSTGGTFRYFIR
jgi:hypothetical protein